MTPILGFNLVPKVPAGLLLGLGGGDVLHEGSWNGLWGLGFRV